MDQVEKDCTVPERCYKRVTQPMKTELNEVATTDQSHKESARRFGVLAKDPQGRITKFRTRRGTLIYRLVDRRDGKATYRDQFTYRVKVDGKQYYFTLGREKDDAASVADEIAAFLEVSSHTVEQAIEK